MEPTADFLVTSTITYRPFRTPPRCRKPRPVPETFTHEFRIPSVTSEQAPVVALVPDELGHYGARPGETAPLRSYGGKLYAAQKSGAQITRAGSAGFPATTRHESFNNWQHEAITQAGKDFTGLLVVDGGIWKVTPEPAYAIVTMGLGSNHGGTYLEIDYFRRYTRVFPLTDYDAAVEAAVDAATKRGDTNAIAGIRKAPKATVLDPTAFSLPSEADRRARAEADVRGFVEKARGILDGPLTRTSLTDVKELMDEARSAMAAAGLDELPRP
jgi:hypothetical protein